MRRLFTSLFLTIVLSASLSFAETVKVSTISNTFSSGELSPRLEGRTDIQAYFNGAGEIENFIVTPSGGLERRPGTYYVTDVKNSSDTTRLIPFQFSTEQAYIIEAGDKYFRFYKDNGIILNGSVPYEITTNYTASQVNGLQYVQDADTMWFVHQNHKPTKLTRTGHTNWTITDFSPSGDPFGGYDSYTKLLLHCDGADASTTFTDVGGNHTVTAIGDARINTTQYKFGNASGFFDGTGDYLNVTKSADFNFTGDFTIDFWSRFNSISGSQQFLGNSYSGGWSFTWAQPTNQLIFWALDGARCTVSFTPSANITYHYAVVRNSGDIKIYVNGTSLGNATYATAINSPYDLYIGRDFTTAAYVNGWMDEIRISKDKARWTANFTVPAEAYPETGYPNSIAIYEQKLTLAGKPDQPQTIWMSETGNYSNFTIGTADDNALSYTIASEQVNNIKWLSSSKALLVGTSGGIFSASSGSTSAGITPTNIMVKRETSFGADDIVPVKIGNYVYYFQRNGKILRELQYTYDIDEYAANEITILSDHITGNGINAMAYQQLPYNILWCVRNDGEIATLTRQIEQKVTGWSRQVTNGTFESVAVIPGNGTDDQVWFVANRTLNGTAVKSVEYLMPFNYTNQSDAFFVDCGLSLYNGTNTSTVGGLEHLNNTSISVFGDGVVLNSTTVASGNITLSTNSSTVHAGLAYPYRLKTMRYDINSNLGTGQGKIKRINKVQLRMYKSYGGQIGSNSTQYNILYDNTTFYTGDKEIFFPSGYDKDAYIVVEGDDPVPMNVLAIMPDLIISDY